jgi:hypothetical protein
MHYIPVQEDTLPGTATCSKDLTYLKIRILELSKVTFPPNLIKLYCFQVRKFDTINISWIYSIL